MGQTSSALPGSDSAVVQETLWDLLVEVLTLEKVNEALASNPDLNPFGGNDISAGEMVVNPNNGEEPIVATAAPTPEPTNSPTARPTRAPTRGKKSKQAKSSSTSKSTKRSKSTKTRKIG